MFACYFPDIVGSVATEGAGLYDGLDWLTAQIKSQMVVNSWWGKSSTTNDTTSLTANNDFQKMLVKDTSSLVEDTKSSLVEDTKSSLVEDTKSSLWSTIYMLWKSVSNV